MDDYNKLYQEEAINWKSYLNSILRIWWVFPITIGISLAIAYVQTLKTSLSYKASSTLLINKDVKPNFGTADKVMTGFGLMDVQKKIENEIAILSSYSLAEKSSLQRNEFFKYYKKDRLRKINIYTQSPFIIQIDSLKPQLTGTYKIVFDDNNKFTITREEGGGVKYDYINHKSESANDLDFEFVYEGLIGEKIETNELNLKVINNPYRLNYSFNNQETFYFQFNTLNSLALRLKNSLNINPLDNNSDIIKLSLEHDNRNEAVDILNSLVNQYFNDNLAEKNQMAVSTINFIDSQLSSLADSLMSTETELEDFRKKNRVINVDLQSASVFGVLQQLENQLAVANLKMRYFDYLKEYIQKESDYSDILAPSIMDVNDVILNKLINDLINANAERINLLSKSTPENPLLRGINKQIEDIKRAIKESVNSLITSTQIEINEVDNQINRYESQLVNIPEIERKLMGIQRSFTITNDIYTYLLQKRAESAIAKASNIPDGKIIDPARRELTRVNVPGKKQNYILFPLIGLMIPIGFVVIKKLLYDYIETKEDITKIVNIPVIATVPHSKFDSKFIIKDHPQSFVSESFRTIRTNLNFMLDSKKSNVILITSSIPKDGKTFMSVNLAQAIAATNKKTIIVGLDLRSPGLSYEFYPENSKGVSTYVTNQSNLEESIQTTEDPNLHVLTSGPTPPNPSELLGSENVNKLIDILKDNYDYIILDTPPINITSDALQVIDQVDAVIYIVRYLHTKANYMDNLKSLHEQNRLKNSAIILNDVKITSFKSYSYAYKYGKYYNFENGNKNKGVVKRLLKI